MEDRDYRKEIGKKIEEAMELGDFAQLEDLIEVPSPETFAKWVDLGQEKHAKRVRRKRILAACAAVLVIAVSAILAIQFIQPPEVEAGPDGNIGIENNMDRERTYKSWEKLPDTVKENFIEVKNLPERYKLEKIVVTEGEFAIKVETWCVDRDNELLKVRQFKNRDESLPKNIVADENNKQVIGETEVYMESESNVETATYKYISGNIIVDVIVPEGTEKSIVESIIKTVQ